MHKHPTTHKQPLTTNELDTITGGVHFKSILRGAGAAVSVGLAGAAFVATAPAILTGATAAGVAAGAALAVSTAVSIYTVVDQTEKIVEEEEIIV